MKPDLLSIQLPSFDGRVPAELSADYILPDVYPDIKRILRVGAKPALIGRYIAGKRLEFSGAVDYIVVFAADTESGETLHSVHFAGEWNGAITEAEDLDGAQIMLEPRIGGCTARLSNPRKVSLKSTVLTDIRITRPSSTEPKLDGSPEDGARLERLIETTPSLRERMITLEPMQISENLEPDASQPAIDEIVTCEARLHFHEARPSIDDGAMNVSLKGEALIDCIYKAAGDGWRSFQRKLPLSYTMAAEDCAAFFAGCAPESLTCDAMAGVTELNIAVGENGYGERRVLELDLTFEPRLHLTGITEAPLTLDAYSTVRESECIRHELDFCSGAKQLSANFSVGEAVSRADLKLPEGCALINAAGDVEFGSIAIERGRAVLMGEATVSCILAAADGSLLSAEPVVPVRCELAAGDLHEPLALEAHGVISDLRVRLDPERLSLDFEVSLCALIRERARRQAVAEVRFGAPIEPRKHGAGMTICYPASGETMWQIARRYNVTMAALESANRDSKRVIMIPRSNGVSGVI